jgi:hypothetical protein
MTLAWPGLWSDGVDAVLDWGKGHFYFFKGDKYKHVHVGDLAGAGPELPIKGNWKGLWDTGVDAAINWGDGVYYFFKGDKYKRFDVATNGADEGAGEELPIIGNWPGLWSDGIDAAINWNGAVAYFFKGNQVVRYCMGKDGAVEGAGNIRFIKDAWPGLWHDGVDAAINWGNGAAFFFKGNQYKRYDMGLKGLPEGAGAALSIGGTRGRLSTALDWSTNHVFFFSGGLYWRFNIGSDCVDVGYPKPIEGNWPGLWPDGFDAALNWGDGVYYFFKGDKYKRYVAAAPDVKEGAGDEKPIANNWPGLWEDGVDAAIHWGKDTYYFFKGDEVMRYYPAAPGIPEGAREKKKISAGWPGLWADGIDAAVNWSDQIAYFFKGDKYQRYDKSPSLRFHYPGVNSFAEGARPPKLTWTSWIGIQMDAMAEHVWVSVTDNRTNRTVKGRSEHTGKLGCSAGF